MCKPANNTYSEPEYAASLARAEALEREITDLCAQINAANYRLLQLIVALDNEKPWGAWGVSPHIASISYCGRRKAHCGEPYSRRPAKRKVNYAGADLWSLRRTTAYLRRPRQLPETSDRNAASRCIALLRGAGPLHIHVHIVTESGEICRLTSRPTMPRHCLPVTAR